MVITIKGRIPSKKNSRINTRSGRSFPSKKYKEWQQNRLSELHRDTIKTITCCDSVEIRFWFPDARRSDLTNKAESVMDLLVDAKILHDDSWVVTGNVTLIPMGIDRINPRAEVFIEH